MSSRAAMFLMLASLIQSYMNTTIADYQNGPAPRSASSACNT
jgi:hypothetical protein